jgi:hypothetical protein
MDSLEDLFSKDPRTLEEKDIERIVTTLRMQKAKWADAEASGKKTLKQAKPKTTATPLLTLDDLMKPGDLKL